MSAARRSCSSSGTSGSWNVSTALGSRDDVVAELEHRQLVARHRRARQPLGQRRLRAHAAPNGMWIDGRRTPSTRFSRSQNSFHVSASGPPISNVRFAAGSSSTACA